MSPRLQNCFLAVFLTACGPKKPPAEQEERSGQGASQSERLGEKEIERARWGRAPGTSPSRERWLEAEVQRVPGEALWKESESKLPDSAAAWWALARIGGERSDPRWLDLLDRGDEKALAALALLSGEASEKGDAFEKALWTRLALAASPREARALWFAIARQGGPFSQRRLFSLAGKLDGEGGAGSGEVKESEEGELWRTVGLLCSRGQALERSGWDALLAALDSGEQRRRDEALYALGRCVAASAELLGTKEERERIARTLGRPERSERFSDEARWWSAWAKLGSLPEELPPAILGNRDEAPKWWIEVEAVRALAASSSGRKELLSRLGARVSSDFEGPRRHVLLTALVGLREGARGEGARGDSAIRVEANKWVEASRGAGNPYFGELLRMEAELLAWIAGEEKVGAESRLSCEREGSKIARSACLQRVSEGWLSQIRAQSPGGELGVREASKDNRTRQLAETALLEMAKNFERAESSSVVAALSEVADPRAKALLREALGSSDVGVAAAAAQAVSDRSLDTGKRDPAAVDPLRALVKRWSNEAGVEARLAAIEALGRLASKPDGAADAGPERGGPPMAGGGAPSPCR